MKHLLLSALALVMCIGSNAQPLLFAESVYQYSIPTSSLYLSDSAQFTHSGGRSSMVNRNFTSYYADMNYNHDTAYIHRFQSGQFALRHRLVQTFNTLDSVTVFEDHSYSTSTQTYTPVVQWKYYYNTNNLPDSLTQFEYSVSNAIWLNKNRVFYTYDGSNRLSYKVGDIWKGAIPTWKPQYVDSLFYNGSGLLSKQKTKTWDILSSTEDSFYHTYYYNGSGKMVTDSYFVKTTYNGITGYEYNTNGYLAKDSTFSQYIIERKEYTYDVNNNLTEIIKWRWDNPTSMFVYSNKQIFTYNSFNQMTGSWYEQWKNGVWEKEKAFRVIYYQIPNNVNDLSEKKDNVTLYPIPATTYINLDLNFDKAQSFSVTIFDMQGRMVKQFTDKADKTYHKNIIVQDMPAGQYMLQVKTNAETLSRNFTIIK